MQTADLVFEQVKTLPDALAREVLDFVGYLKQRGDRMELHNLMLAQQTSLSHVWADEPDDVWDV